MSFRRKKHFQFRCIHYSVQIISTGQIRTAIKYHFSLQIFWLGSKYSMFKSAAYIVCGIRSTLPRPYKVHSLRKSIPNFSSSWKQKRLTRLSPSNQESQCFSALDSFLNVIRDTSHLENTHMSRGRSVRLPNFRKVTGSRPNIGSYLLHLWLINLLLFLTSKTFHANCVLSYHTSHAWFPAMVSLFSLLKGRKCTFHAAIMLLFNILRKK
jgi:hypothetical protein